jgi:hypothetical protein
MKTQLLALATALAFGSLMASPVRAQANRPLIPEIVDVTHATKKSAAFFHSFFMAKSRHDVDATMNHFSKSTLTYIDAPASTPTGWLLDLEEIVHRRSALYGEPEEEAEGDNLDVPPGLEDLL